MQPSEIPGRKKGQSGRPRISEGEIRSYTIGVRVNLAEITKLQLLARSVGLPLSQWIRQIALSRFIPRPLVPEINRQAYVELAKLIVSLNQLTRAVNEGRPVASLGLLHQLAHKVKALRLELIGVENDSQAN